MPQQTKSEKLCLLVTMLEGEPPVSWITVERLLADFPGWLRFAENVRDAPRNAQPYRFGQIPLNTAGMVETPQRDSLLGVLTPYAALLDDRLTAHEKMARITKFVGKKQDEFWNSALANRDDDIREAAEWLLNKKQGHGTLLRAASFSPDDGENLLLPSEASTPETSPPVSFWARLLGKKRA